MHTLVRQYSKTEHPNREIKDIIIPSLHFNIPKPWINAKSIEFGGRSYTKPIEGKRDFYIIALIIEDSKRTVAYFRPIINKNLRGIKIFSVLDSSSGIPVSHMQGEANRCVVEWGLNFEEGDELFMLCDLDHYRSALVALYKSKNPAWNLIISNPCIEVWFYYHFNNTRPLFYCEQNERAYSRQMKQLCNNCKEGGINHTTLLSDINIEIPIRNAKTMYETEVSHTFIPILGTTQMFSLMEHLNDLGFID